MDKIRLKNGVDIPVIGFGTWQVKTGAKEAVLEALKLGYRHIDTAAIYKNETAVGEAWVQSGLKRSDLFITTKLWNSVLTYEETLQAFAKSCENLQTDYVDLYLLHWPKEYDSERYRAIEDLYMTGKIRAIGVSNYHIHHYEKLMRTARIKPMVNQIELHPLLNQEKLRTFFALEGVAIESYSPLMSGKMHPNPQIESIAQKHHKTAAQIFLKWNLQKGCVILPKSVTPSRILENIQLFDFELSEQEMKIIDDLNTDTRVGSDPDHFDF